MHRRYFLLTPLFASAITRAVEPLRPEAVDYTTFDGKKVKVFAWRGKRMAFLTKLDGLDPKLMGGLCDTFDKVYDFYREATGREPQKLKELNGLLTVAEVDQTCGAGCGYLGATGTDPPPGCFPAPSSGGQPGGTFARPPPTSSAATSGSIRRNSPIRNP